jgi:hypothetical protein
MGQVYRRARFGGPSFEADPRHAKLEDLRLHCGERFTCVDNFIDHWECPFRLEAILPPDSRRLSPVCISGKRAAPSDETSRE